MIEEIKSNYLRVITDNEIINEYRIPLDIEDVSGNILDSELVILVEFYEEGFKKDLMIKIESFNFASVNFNNEDICSRGEHYESV